jgi:DNA-binding response OmpR family regulator
VTTQATSVLLIEDDPGVALSLRAALEREGYSVAWRSRGSEGIAYAREQAPQLIILDLRLPDGSGFDVCREMRRQGLRQPILMLTVQADEVDKVLGLEMGADDYVTKPFALRELLSRIRALLRRAYGELSGAESGLLYAGDLTIDVERGRIERGRQSISLTPTEFRLLVYLVRHPGQALTREQIVDAVWGHTADVDSERTVNVHIRRLREKVELDPNRPSLILTVPGIGYRFNG